jgi:hypothetical protein
MRKQGLWGATFALTIAFSATSQAEDVEKSIGIRSNAGYGVAGCGLGSLVFEPSSKWTQIFAATTNGTFGTQTFGISSGTSNCDHLSGGTASAEAFVETNRGALAKDIARGQGETLSSLGRLAGCQESAKVGPSLQQNFKKIFPEAGMSDAEVGKAVVKVLKEDASLACSNLT